MANAVVGDYGDLVKMNTGQDLSTHENLRVYITKPDGTLIVKAAADGVEYGGTGNVEMHYTIESGLLDMDGTYFFSAYFEESGNFSQPTPVEYEVKRRNQTP